MEQDAKRNAEQPPRLRYSVSYGQNHNEVNVVLGGREARKLAEVITVAESLVEVDEAVLSFGKTLATFSHETQMAER